MAIIKRQVIASIGKVVEKILHMSGVTNGHKFFGKHVVNFSKC